MLLWKLRNGPTSLGEHTANLSLEALREPEKITTSRKSFHGNAKGYNSRKSLHVSKHHRHQLFQFAPALLASATEDRRTSTQIAIKYTLATFLSDPKVAGLAEGGVKLHSLLPRQLGTSLKVTDPLWTPFGPPMDLLWTPYGPLYRMASWKTSCWLLVDGAPVHCTTYSTWPTAVSLHPNNPYNPYKPV
jgi:hypothetical protein